MYKKDTLFFGIMFSWIFLIFFDIFIYLFIDPWILQWGFIIILFVSAMLLNYNKRFREYMLQDSRIFHRLTYKKKK